MPLWQLQEEQEERVLEELANRFGEIDEYAELPFSDQLNGIIHNAVQDNSADYRSALLQSLSGSNLEDTTSLISPYGLRKCWRKAPPMWS